MSVVLKCGACGEKINYLTDKQYTYYGNKYYHGNCFVKKKTTLKKAAWSEQKCLEYIESNKTEVDKKIQQSIAKDDFYQWLMEYYRITVIPSYFFTKIADVLSGKYKGLSVPIPIEDIHEMWKRKANYLTKTYLKNEASGKTMTPSQRLNYDLAILVNKYDSYLAWKEETLAEQIQTQARIKEKAETKYSVPVKPTKQDGEINIYNILDEI